MRQRTRIEAVRHRLISIHQNGVFFMIKQRIPGALDRMN
jgi:hypothetical protein